MAVPITTFLRRRMCFVFARVTLYSLGSFYFALFICVFLFICLILYIISNERGCHWDLSNVVLYAMTLLQCLFLPFAWENGLGYMEKVMVDYLLCFFCICFLPLQQLWTDYGI